MEPPGDGLSGALFGLEDGQAQGEEGLLRMPAIEGPLDPDQEEPFQDSYTDGAYTGRNLDVNRRWGIDLNGNFRFELALRDHPISWRLSRL